MIELVIGGVWVDVTLDPEDDDDWEIDVNDLPGR